MNFLTSTWLWLLPLIFIPLIIHYLFKRRFNTLLWGPVFLIDRAIQKRKKIHRVEEKLLLLIRTLMLLFLILAFAQPEIKKTSIGTGLGLRPIVILFDRSLSTFRKDGIRSVNERLKEDCLRYIETLDRNQHLFFLDFPKGNVVEGKDLISSTIKSSSPQWFPGDITHAVAQLQEVLQERKITDCQVEIFSDFQKSDFNDLVGWPEGWKVHTHTLDLPKRVNWSITDLRAGSGFPLLDKIWTIQVEVVGAEGLTNIRLSQEGNVFFDEEITIPSTGRLRFSVPYIIQMTGPHKITAELKEDVYHFDNTRYLIINVPDQPRVLILSGQESPDLNKDESKFFELALDPRREYDVDVTAIPPKDLKGYDIYVLANVANISDFDSRTIIQEIEDGSLFAFFPGPQTNLASFRKKFDFLPNYIDSPIKEGSFSPISSSSFRYWYSYFRPYTFKNYYVLDESGQALWKDGSGQSVLRYGTLKRGHWVAGGFSLNNRHGNWLGSPLYVGLARSLVTHYRHSRYMGKSEELSLINPIHWPRPGFYTNDNQLLAVNFPSGESDTKLFDPGEDQTAYKAAESLPRPLGLTFILIAFIFLFLETILQMRSK